MLRLIALCFFVMLSCVSCGANLFTEFADTNSEDAIAFEAEYLMGEEEWTEAIDVINLLPQDSLEKARFRSLLASAYAGRCGLNFVGLTTKIAEISTNNSLFEILLDAEKADFNYTDCKEAEDLLQAIGDATERDTDQNLLMAYASLTKIGAILADLADTDNDGVVDSAAPDFSACALPNTEANEIAVSFSQVASSFAEIDSVGGALNLVMTTICTATPSLCQNDETTDVTALERSAIKTLVNSDPTTNSIGLGSGPVCP